MPQTNAEMTAYQLGQEMAHNPHLSLQPPEVPFAAGMIAMNADRISAAQDLGYELFGVWVERGHRSVVADDNGA